MNVVRKAVTRLLFCFFSKVVNDEHRKGKQLRKLLLNTFEIEAVNNECSKKFSLNTQSSFGSYDHSQFIIEVMTLIITFIWKMANNESAQEKQLRLYTLWYKISW